MTEFAYDRLWMQVAIDLSGRCPPVDTAYSVGAIIVGADGTELARGYSRETDRYVHAEEVALAKIRGDERLAGATLYSTLEPCSVRKSRPVTCTELILAARIRRVVLALREPPLFVTCEGVGLLQARGVEVVELTDLADQIRVINARVLTPARLSAASHVATSPGRRSAHLDATPLRE